ncbi:hypothetical protein LF845_06125 [Deferribacterales bacterium Es71-Z0220]|uniref:hypothetical protein n=1 Tax=Deferrivibrio essentukiensis TaxID=2880922 RepID=UPI001F614F0C|nr:hypothetical protein [Deferrivibrio essentukiensis]MCB4204534.1 hypothetical protein [Deferrivibrio essentukiensis]
MYLKTIKVAKHEKDALRSLLFLHYAKNIHIEYIVDFLFMLESVSGNINYSNALKTYLSNIAKKRLNLTENELNIINSVNVDVNDYANNINNKKYAKITNLLDQKINLLIGNDINIQSIFAVGLNKSNIKNTSKNINYTADLSAAAQYYNDYVSYDDSIASVDFFDTNSNNNIDFTDIKTVLTTLHKLNTNNTFFTNFFINISKEEREAFLFNVYLNNVNNIKVKNKLNTIIKKLKEYNYIDKKFSLTKELQTYNQQIKEAELFNNDNNLQKNKGKTTVYCMSR